MVSLKSQQNIVKNVPNSCHNFARNNFIFTLTGLAIVAWTNMLTHVLNNVLSVISVLFPETKVQQNEFHLVLTNLFNLN